MTPVKSTPDIQHRFELDQNSSMLFNLQTSEASSLLVATIGSLGVYDVRGARVGVIFEDQQLGADKEVVRVNASSPESGTSWYRFASAEFMKTCKILILK
jgi:hypothetical protein